MKRSETRCNFECALFVLFVWALLWRARKGRLIVPVSIFAVSSPAALTGSASAAAVVGSAGAAGVSVRKQPRRKLRHVSRVYADANSKRPKEYWDYEALSVEWG